MSAEPALFSYRVPRRGYVILGSALAIAVPWTWSLAEYVAAVIFGLIALLFLTHGLRPLHDVVISHEDLRYWTGLGWRSIGWADVRTVSLRETASLSPWAVDELDILGEGGDRLASVVVPPDPDDREKLFDTVSGLAELVGAPGRGEQS